MAKINKILFKRSKTAGIRPTPASMSEGELFINLADRVLLTKSGSNLIDLGFAKGGNVDGNINQTSGNFVTKGTISDGSGRVFSPGNQPSWNQVLGLKDAVKEITNDVIEFNRNIRSNRGQVIAYKNGDPSKAIGIDYLNKDYPTIVTNRSNGWNFLAIPDKSGTIALQEDNYSKSEADNRYLRLRYANTNGVPMRESYGNTTGNTGWVCIAEIGDGNLNNSSNARYLFTVVSTTQGYASGSVNTGYMQIAVTILDGNKPGKNFSVNVYNFGGERLVRVKQINSAKAEIWVSVGSYSKIVTSCVTTGPIVFKNNVMVADNGLPVGGTGEATTYDAQVHYRMADRNWAADTFQPKGDYATNTALNNGLALKFDKSGGTITGDVTFSKNAIKSTKGTHTLPDKSGTLMQVGDYGWGGRGLVYSMTENEFTEFIADSNNVSQVLRNSEATKYSSRNAPTAHFKVGNLSCTIAAGFGGDKKVIVTAGDSKVENINVYELYHDLNTTKDSNGFLRTGSATALTTGQVTQTMGSSTTNVMSQAIVTNLINDRYTKADSDGRYLRMNVINKTSMPVFYKTANYGDYTDQRDLNYAGFYRTNGLNSLPHLMIHVPHSSGLAHGRGIGFDYGSNGYGIYTYAYDGDGKYLGAKPIALSENYYSKTESDGRYYQKSQTYTRSEVDSRVNIKANRADVYAKSAVYQKTETYSRAEVDSRVNIKANRADVYAKSAVYQKTETYSRAEVDSRVNIKANSADVYQKTETYSRAEVDSKINTQALKSGIIHLPRVTATSNGEWPNARTATKVINCPSVPYASLVVITGYVGALSANSNSEVPRSAKIEAVTSGGVLVSDMSFRSNVDGEINGNGAQRYATCTVKVRIPANTNATITVNGFANFDIARYDKPKSLWYEGEATRIPEGGIIS